MSTTLFLSLEKLLTKGSDFTTAVLSKPSNVQAIVDLQNFVK